MAEAKRSNNRNRELLDAAAKCFAENGFTGTSMRDIAKHSGMLPGSIYYHYPSKEALLLAIYEEGVDRFCERIDEATEAADQPWEALYQAIRAHIGAITADDDYSRIINRVMPEDVPGLAAQLQSMRDRYERRLKVIIDAVDLDPSVDRGLFRLMLLGASNWTQFWFRADAGKSSPDAVAKQFIHLLRFGAGGTPTDMGGSQ